MSPLAPVFEFSVFDIAKTQKPRGLAAEALAFIAKLYEIERRLREHPHAWLAVRATETVPLLGQSVEDVARRPLPLLATHGAARAGLSNWQALTRFTEDGVLAADSNLVERTIRPVAVGRKAWRLAGSPRCGEAAAVAFPLIETAKPNGIEPCAYPNDLLRRLHSRHQHCRPGTGQGNCRRSGRTSPR